MQWLFIIIAILWAVIGAAGNKKKQQARKEAEQRAYRQAQESSTPQSPSAGMPVPPQMRPSVPVPPQMRSVPPAAQPRTAIPQTPGAAASRQTVPTAQVQQRMSTTHTQAAPASRLTQLEQTKQHTLRPSNETGHAHEETSMTGFEPECPPELLRRGDPDAAAHPGKGLPAFTWNANAVLNGIVYAEILGKPKALRG